MSDDDEAENSSGGYSPVFCVKVRGSLGALLWVRRTVQRSGVAEWDPGERLPGPLAAGFLHSDLPKPSRTSPSLYSTYSGIFTLSDRKRGPRH